MVVECMRKTGDWLLLQSDITVASDMSVGCVAGRNGPRLSPARISRRRQWLLHEAAVGPKLACDNAVCNSMEGMQEL